MGVNVAMVIKQTLRDSHKQAGHQKLHAHTHKHTKLQFTTTTAVTQRHSVPPMKGRLCGLFLEGLKGCCSGAMEEVVAHRQALLAASHTLLYPPQAPSLHLTCNMKCFYLPPEPYVASRKCLLAFAHSVLNAPVSTTELQLRYSNHSNWEGHKRQYVCTRWCQNIHVPIFLQERGYRGCDKKL